MFFCSRGLAIYREGKTHDPVFPVFFYPQNGMGQKEVVAAADKALYEPIERGRNRVCNAC